MQWQGSKNDQGREEPSAQERRRDICGSSTAFTPCTTLRQAGKSVALVVAAADAWLTTSRRGAAAASRTAGERGPAAGLVDLMVR